MDRISYSGIRVRPVVDVKVDDGCGRNKLWTWKKLVDGRSRGRQSGRRKKLWTERVVDGTSCGWTRSCELWMHRTVAADDAVDGSPAILFNFVERSTEGNTSSQLELISLVSTLLLHLTMREHVLMASSEEQVAVPDAKYLYSFNNFSQSVRHCTSRTVGVAVLQCWCKAPVQLLL